MVTFGPSLLYYCLPSPGECNTRKKQDPFKVPQDRDLPVEKDLMDKQPESETPPNQVDLEIPHNLTHFLDRKHSVSGDTVKELPEDPLLKAKWKRVSKG